MGTTFNGSVESEVRVTDSDRMVGINCVRLFVGLFIYLFASVSVVTALCLYLRPSRLRFAEDPDLNADSWREEIVDSSRLSENGAVCLCPRSPADLSSSRN